ncbi:MAG: hypothetical protein ACK56W_12005 [Pirellula sp.]|jgi:hypothetical protein|nr:hypothetical protein [Pirellula sp.]
MSLDPTSLGNLIPGFGAYFSEQQRRDDDLALRRYLVERLQESKKLLQSFAVPFVEKANFDAIKGSEALRTQIELMQSKLRAATEGYSSWFESNRIDEKKLKEVVDLDRDLVGFIDKLDSLISQLDAAKPDFSEATAMIDRIKERFSRRKDILTK